MIKKLQSLKAKKGFTLVELVVVIAIIGVLAAILVPTMIGVVQDSNIASANTVAGKIKDQVEIFRTNCDNQAPLKGAEDNVLYVPGTVVNGTWTFGDKAAAGNSAAPNGDDKDSSATKAETDAHGTGKLEFGTAKDGKYTYKFTHAEGDNKNFCLDLFLQDVLRDFKNGAFVLYFQNGACIGAAVMTGPVTSWSIPENDVATREKLGGVMVPGVECKLEWSGKKAGLCKDGTIIGTSPKVELKVETKAS